MAQKQSTPASGIANTQKSDPYTYSIDILTQQHVAAAANIFAKCFCKYEPLVKHLKISEDYFKDLAREILTQAAADALSVVALDKTGKVVGLAVSENLHAPAAFSDFPKLQPIFALFAALSTTVKKLNLRQNTVAHIWVTAVDDSTQGIGLSTRINNACVIRAIEQGFKYIYCEFTNAINEKIMHYYPDKVKLNEIAVADFTFNGGKPFNNLAGYATAYIMAAAPFYRIDDIKAQMR